MLMLDAAWRDWHAVLSNVSSGRRTNSATPGPSIPFPLVGIFRWIGGYGAGLVLAVVVCIFGDLFV